MREAQNYQKEPPNATLSLDNRLAARSSEVGAHNMAEEQSQNQEGISPLDPSSVSESPISEPGQHKDVAESSIRHATESHLKIRYSKVLLYVFCFHSIFQIILALCLAGVFGYYGNLVAAMMVLALAVITIFVIVDGVQERLWQIKQGTTEYP